jgi:hypothetical protein
MSILSDDDLYSFVGKDDSQDEFSYYTTVRDAVEDWIESYCARTFESTAHKDRYNGTGSSRLLLDNYPVISIERLAITPIDAIRVRNTNSYTHATVSVTSTGIVLRRDGVSNSTVTFASCPTMSSVVTAISIISGWEAALQDSTYSSYQSTELIEKMGLYTLKSSWAYLQMPEEAEYDFDVDSDKGIITLYGLGLEAGGLIGFPTGVRNIFADYTAGYSSTNMPADLMFAIKVLSKNLIQRVDDNAMGVRSYTTGSVSMSFFDSASESFPPVVLEILSKYRRIKV